MFVAIFRKSTRQMEAHPTEHFQILEPQYPSIDVSELHKFYRWKY